MRVSLFSLSLIAINVFFLCGCVKVSRTPALSGNQAQEHVLYGGVSFTSGSFQRAHEIIGILQMNQEGFHSTFIGEVNKDGTDPGEILKVIGGFARDQGAHGIQHFSLIMENPKTKGEEAGDKVVAAIEIVAATLEGDYGKAALTLGKGEKTVYYIKGEMVRWIDEDEPVSDIESVVETESVALPDEEQ